MSMSAVGLAATTSIAGIFGMNLVSGIEEAPLAFALVTAGSGLVGAAVVACVEIKQCVECTREFFTKSFLGDDAAVLAPSSGEEPASPRHRAGIASMACKS